MIKASQVGTSIEGALALVTATFALGLAFTLYGFMQLAVLSNISLGAFFELLGLVALWATFLGGCCYVSVALIFRRPDVPEGLFD